MLAPKQYAQLLVGNSKEFACLEQLWTKESNWRPKAQNKIKINGKQAGGIPQIMGLSPQLPANLQIDKGLDYIKHRYQTPCNAWKFWLQQHEKGGGWY